MMYSWLDNSNVITNFVILILIILFLYHCRCGCPRGTSIKGLKMMTDWLSPSSVNYVRLFSKV